MDIWGIAWYDGYYTLLLHGSSFSKCEARGDPFCILHTSEGLFWSTFFEGTKIARGALFLHFDHQILPIFSQAYIFFVTLLAPPCLSRYFLFTMGHCGDLLFSVVCTLKLICCTWNLMFPTRPVSSSIGTRPRRCPHPNFWANKSLAIRNGQSWQTQDSQLKLFPRCASVNPDDEDMDPFEYCLAELQCTLLKQFSMLCATHGGKNNV